jgi:hypothetical protein
MIWQLTMTEGHRPARRGGREAPAPWGAGRALAGSYAPACVEEITQ